MFPKERAPSTDDQTLTLTLALALAASCAFFCLSLGGIVGGGGRAVTEEAKKERRKRKESDEAGRGDRTDFFSDQNPREREGFSCSCAERWRCCEGGTVEACLCLFTREEEEELSALEASGRRKRKNEKK